MVKRLNIKWWVLWFTCIVSVLEVEAGKQQISGQPHLCPGRKAHLKYLKKKTEGKKKEKPPKQVETD
jgi:hypothetical protein